MSESAVIEKYRFKVVYPGGVHVRTSPGTEAEKTGIILEYGETFEASKSLVLDGVNFVKLSDSSGWVFGNKGDTEILELLEVCRMPARPALRPVSETDFSPASPARGTNPFVKSDSSSSLQGVGPKSIQSTRVSQKFWRDIRAKVLECTTLEQFCDVAKTCTLCKGDAKAEQEKSLIRFLVSVTRDMFCEFDISGLDSALLLFVNLGFKLSRAALSLVISSADQMVERIHDSCRVGLLCALSELGKRTKAQRTELGKLADLLSDDIKNFHQRWLLVKVAKEIEISSRLGASSKPNFKFLMFTPIPDVPLATPESNENDTSPTTNTSTSADESCGSGATGDNTQENNNNNNNNGSPSTGSQESSSSSGKGSAQTVSVMAVPVNDSTVVAAMSVQQHHSRRTPVVNESSSGAFGLFSTGWLGSLVCTSSRVGSASTAATTQLIDESDKLSFSESLRNRIASGFEKLANPDVQRSLLV